MYILLGLCYLNILIFKFYLCNPLIRTVKGALWFQSYLKEYIVWSALFLLCCPSKKSGWRYFSKTNRNRCRPGKIWLRMFKALQKMIAHLCPGYLTEMKNKVTGTRSVLKHPGRTSASASLIKPIPHQGSIFASSGKTHRGGELVRGFSAFASTSFIFREYTDLEPHQDTSEFSQPSGKLCPSSQVAGQGQQMSFEVLQMSASLHCLILGFDYELPVIFNLLSRFHLRGGSGLYSSLWLTRVKLNLPSLANRIGIGENQGASLSNDTDQQTRCKRGLFGGKGEEWVLNAIIWKANFSSETF